MSPFAIVQLSGSVKHAHVPRFLTLSYVSRYMSWLRDQGMSCICTVGACECTGYIHMSEYACALDIFTFEPECGTDGWRNVESS